MALESDLAIRHAAERYLESLQKVDELKNEAEDRLFSGSPGTIYHKRLGLRPLTKEDKENIVGARGTEEDRQSLVDFNQAQIDLSQRLKSVGRLIGPLINQAELNRFNYYPRLKRPELWTADEMVRVVDVLIRFQI